MILYRLLSNGKICLRLRLIGLDLSERRSLPVNHRRIGCRAANGTLLQFANIAIWRLLPMSEKQRLGLSKRASGAAKRKRRRMNSGKTQQQSFAEHAEYLKQMMEKKGPLYERFLAGMRKHAERKAALSNMRQGD